MGEQSFYPKPSQTSQPKQGIDPDVPRYDPSTKTFYSNPETYAAKFPDLWKAKAFQEGKYPAVNSFVPGRNDPQWAGPLSFTLVALSSYTSAVTGRGGPGKKGKKEAQPGGAQQVALMSRLPFAELKSKPLPGVDRHFLPPELPPPPTHLHLT